MNLHLCRVVLNPQCLRVQLELLRPYQLHRTLWRVYAGAGRVLYRVEHGPEAPLLLVQGGAAGDWEPLRRLGYLHEPHDLLPENPAEKVFEPRFAAGQVLQFRLRANPTFRAGRRRLGHLQAEWQAAWLERKGAESGFEVLQACARPEGLVTLRKGAQRLRLYGVLYEGLLRVRQPEVFSGALRGGLGSGKAFGFGLLSVKRPWEGD